jgi:hypothetical protein
MGASVSDKEPEKQIPWYNRKALLIAWLLVFAPIGLFGLWKTAIFEKNMRIGIAIGVVILFFAGGFSLGNAIYPLILFPLAIYLLWKSDEVKRNIVVGFVIAWVVVLILFLVNAQLGGKNFDDSYIGGSCAAVTTEAGCTYFRDDNCNVIAKQCN